MSAAMDWKIYDTMQQERRSIDLQEPGKIGLYVCGVTVYDVCHIGHARSQVAFDVIQRALREMGYEVNYVRNFTDVDDKIIKRANERGIDCTTLTEENIEFFYRDMDALGIQRPEIEPKVTEHIPQIIESIEEIIANGYGYEVEGDVYFDVENCPWYGELSGRKLDDMEAGRRVDVDGRKRNPMDFALWKKAKPGEPFWDSPWGEGRPGWHIECSVMSTLYLGETFDIHGGGRDLIFPHHENERAQALAHRPDSHFAHCWSHNGFVNIGGEKMGKSLGNFFTIEELLRKYPGEALRHHLLSTHYRNPINFEVQPSCGECGGDISQEDIARLGEDGVEEGTCPHCQATYDKESARKAIRFPGVEESVRRVQYYYETMARIDDLLAARPVEGDGELSHPEALATFEEQFWQAIGDDFNAPQAIAATSALLKLANELADQKKPKDPARRTLSAIREAFGVVGRTLGLMEQEPKAYLDAERSRRIEKAGIDPAEIDGLIAQRAEARKAKDWARADAIRDELNARGIILLDSSSSGTSWTID